jgi:hypothetical protein
MHRLFGNPVAVGLREQRLAAQLRRHVAMLSGLPKKQG